jgi:hypothetical protein
MGANMQSGSDQPFTQIYNGSTYAISGIVARQKSGSCSIACLGGIYDAASKSGNVIVAPTQSWLTLNVGVIVNAVLSTLTGNQWLTNSPILSLTTPSTSACSADFYIYGFDLS